MKSKAQVKGHPIHPMLATFPIAFLYGALGFDASTGAAKAGPADRSIGVHAVEVASGEVRLTLKP